PLCRDKYSTRSLFRAFQTPRYLFRWSRFRVAFFAWEVTSLLQQTRSLRMRFRFHHFGCLPMRLRGTSLRLFFIKIMKRQNCWTQHCWTNLKLLDRKSTRLNSSHVKISYAVFCL